MAAAATACLLDARPAAAACQPSQFFNLTFICDIHSEADLREAAQLAVGSFEVNATLHTNIVLTAPVQIVSTLNVNGNSFSLTGRFVGRGNLGFSGPAPSTLTVSGPTDLTISSVSLLRLSADINGNVNFLPRSGNATDITAPVTINGSLGLIMPVSPTFGPWDAIVDTKEFTVTITGGAITEGQGHAARLVKVGSGTLILRGNSSSGIGIDGVLVAGGVLNVSEDASLGVPDRVVPGTFLDGAPLTLDTGTLQAGASFTVEREVQLGAGGGGFDSNGFTLSLGAVSGSGSLTKIGDGTLLLTAPTTYSGATRLERGTLRVGPAGMLPTSTSVFIGTGASLESAAPRLAMASLSGYGSLVLEQSAAQIGADNSSSIFGGVISGTGSLTKSGSGTLTLTGRNTYMGGTTVESGSLVGTTESLQGNIANEGAIDFLQDVDGAFGGLISGSGTVTKSGAGAVTFGRAQSYTGLTRVAQGHLTVNGLKGSILVDTGATLAAEGTIGGSVLVNGRLQPFGTQLTIDGNLQLAAPATYVLDVGQPPTSVDVFGHVDIDGARLGLTGSSAGLPRVSARPLFKIHGGVTGDFSGIDGTAALDAFLRSRGSQVFVILERTDFTMESAGANPNARAAGAALDRIRPTSSPPLREVIRSLGAMPFDALSGTLEQLAGSVAPNALQLGALDAADVLRSVSDRLVDRRSGGAEAASVSGAAPAAGNVWLRLTGNPIALSSSDQPTRSYGGLAGADRWIAGRRTLIGAFAGYDRIASDADMTRLRDRRYRGGAYVTSAIGGGYLAGAAEVGFHTIETDRRIVFASPIDALLDAPVSAGFDHTATGRYPGHDVAAFIEMGWPAAAGGIGWEPIAGLDAGRASTGRFNESDAGPVSVVGSDGSATTVRAALGLRAMRAPGGSASPTFRPHVEARYLRELSGRAAVHTAFADATSTPFVVESDWLALNTADVSGGVLIRARGTVSVSANYRGLFRAHDSRHLFSLGLDF